MSERSLYVGFDLCEDYSQLSCYNLKTYEPESLCISNDKTKYLLPTVLGVKKDSKEWLIGEDALAGEREKTVVIIDHLIEKLIRKEEINILNALFHPIVLLEKYLRKSLQLLKKNYPNDSIKYLVVTISDYNPELADCIYKALDNLGIGRDRAKVISHLNSYGYYALSQNKELWLNDVSLFDFNSKGLQYHQLSINHKTKPYIVGFTSRDFTEVLQCSMLEESSKEQLEYTFSNIAKQLFHKQIISTMYITGKGFEGDWADNTIKELCVGKRGFKGQNLYTKGACYAAKEFAGDGKLNDYLFFDEDMITSNILVSGYIHQAMNEIILVKAATPWYLVNEKINLILDDTDEITLFIQDVLKRETAKVVFPIDIINVRPNKTTRLELGIKFISKCTALVTIKDRGFGDFYPTTYRIWEHKIQL